MECVCGICVWSVGHVECGGRPGSCVMCVWGDHFSGDRLLCGKGR